MTNKLEQKEETPKLITREEYIQDIKIRWKLFISEAKSFIEDVKKIVNFIQPYISKAINKTKELYKSLKKAIKK
tara:strand:+ start:113 stop:334 length:222 start_codon:yes stop_codon:yes gene_type:complete